MSGENDKANVEKEDLLRLLACLQSELEAREDVINTLRLEKLHAINFRAKYGFGNIEKSDIRDCEDPFFALQRDSLVVSNDSSNTEADLKPYYDTQLVQLENLITSQKRAQDTMRDQLLLMESKYLKVCKELEDERRKHERDAAQGDDVLVMLEKERERLKSEVEYERTLNRKLEKELRKVLQAMKEQTILLSRQKWAAISIIKEHHRLSRDCQLNLEPASDRLKAPMNVLNKSSEESSCKKIISNSSFDNAQLSEECIRLQALLTEEINARKMIQDRFERLQKEHENLLNKSSKIDVSTESSPMGFPKCSTDSARNVVVDRQSDPGTPIVPVNSSISAQRPKPNPPMRRSSEITCGMPSLGSPTTPNALADPSLINGFNASETAVRLDPGGPMDATITDSFGVALTVTVPSGMTVTPPTSGLSSRSSTPSPPPPPPPPIQLHYPYPAMQSHMHTIHSRSTNATSPFIPNTTRPLSGGSITHTISSKPRPALPASHGPHQTNSPYQTSYVSPGSPQVQANRMPFTQTSRGAGSRKPTAAVITHSTQADGSPSFSSYSTPQSSPFVSSPPNKSTVASQFQLRSTNQHVTSSSSASGSHHFPAYPAVRQHSSGMSGNNARAVRSSVPPASTALSSSTGGPLGSGHVCINSK